MKSIYAIVPRRSRDEHTFAITEARVGDDFGDEQSNDVHALFGGIQQAVTDWFRRTERGKSAIRSNNYDFNVGDLAEWNDDESLVPYLREQGILAMNVETYSDTAGHSWEFDDVLFDDVEINAEIG